MTTKEYLVIKNWLVKVEKEIKDEAYAEKANPVEVEKAMPIFLERVLDAKGIDADEYFRIDRLLDKEGANKKELGDKEIDLEELESENEVEQIKKSVSSFVKDFLAKLKKK